MKYMENSFIQKSHAPEGAWMYEPDYVQWPFEALYCVIKRNPSLLNWCGYVGVAKGHPTWRMESPPVSIYGGITFAQKVKSSKEFYIAEANDPKELWFFGFDCAHFGDFIPAMPQSFAIHHQHASYKDMRFVIEQCEFFATQLNLIK